jgi:hypothetical protein
MAPPGKGDAHRRESRAMNPPPIPYLPPPSDTARLLGHLGLLPFGVGALLVWVGLAPDLHAFVTLALSVYAGVIISFLGGIHWGLAMRHSAPPAKLFIWGVVPALVAWPAVVMPPFAGLVVHGVMLLVCYAVDRRLYPQQGVGAWLTLRFRLSMVAALCCFFAARGT